MNKGKLLKLLGLIIKRDTNKIENFLKSEDLDLDILKNIVSANLLAGNMYSILLDPQLKSYFPDTFIEYFKLSYMLQWAKNETLVEEMGKLAELFKKANKDVIFLKGPLLAQRYFGNIDQRTIADIDILAKNEDISDLERLLEKGSYILTSNALLNKNITKKFVHHFEYRKQDVVLELHWALSQHISFHLDYKKIWQQKNQLVLNEESFFVLSDEYELVFQFVSVLRDIELGDICLRSFQDIYLILKAIDTNLDWEKFFDNRKKEGLFTISLNILDLVMTIIACDDEFTKLSHYIEENIAHIRYKSIEDKLKLIEHSRFALRNKLWAFDVYDTHPFKAFCWWALSLPFRLIDLTPLNESRF